jgi:hypothetical protein
MRIFLAILGLLLCTIDSSAAARGVVRVPPVITLLQSLSPQTVGEVRVSINSIFDHMGEVLLPPAYKSSTGEMHGSQFARALMACSPEVEAHGSIVVDVLGLDEFKTLHSIFDLKKGLDIAKKRHDFKLRGPAADIWWKLSKVRQIVEASKNPDVLQIRLASLYDR